MSAYRLLIRGTLVQESAASFGGTEQDHWADAPLCRDGLGRYTLRGEGLAGALTAMARKLFRTVPEAILGGGGAPSVWRPFISHPEQPDTILAELRQCVRIDPETGAADDGAMFDLEILPRGTRWPFLLQVDLNRVPEAQKPAVLAVTARTLKAWENGYCWLGRGVARGLGWCSLQDTKVVSLAASEAWPDAFAADYPHGAAGRLTERGASTLTEFAARAPKIPADGDWRWQEYELVLSFGTGDGEKRYGADLLSVGGHGTIEVDPPWPGLDRLLLPEAMTGKSYEKHWNPDGYPAVSGNSLTPILPGSSLRGPLRHGLARWLRMKAPPGAVGVLAPLHRLMGALKGERDAPESDGTEPKHLSSPLLVRDAYLSDDCCDWKMALVHAHAEDEFSGGVFEGSKFDRVALMDAKFKTRMVLEARKSEMAELKEILDVALALAEGGWLGVGGAASRGFGGCRWEIERREEYGEAQ